MIPRSLTPLRTTTAATDDEDVEAVVVWASPSSASTSATTAFRRSKVRSSRNNNNNNNRRRNHTPQTTRTSRNAYNNNHNNNEKNERTMLPIHPTSSSPSSTTHPSPSPSRTVVRRRLRRRHPEETEGEVETLHVTPQPPKSQKQQHQRPPLLFALLEHQEWSHAIERIHNHPQECQGVYSMVMVLGTHDPTPQPQYQLHSALTWACQNQAPLELIDELLSSTTNHHPDELLSTIAPHQTEGGLRLQLQPPLHVALAAQASNEVVQRLLVANPFAARIPDDQGRYPLHWAVQRWYQLLVQQQQQQEPTASSTTTTTSLVESEDLVRMIMVAYPEATQQVDSYGHTPLDVVVTTTTTSSHPIPARMVHLLEQAPLWKAIVVQEPSYHDNAMRAVPPAAAATSSRSTPLRPHEVEPIPSSSAQAQEEIQRLQQALQLEQETCTIMEEEMNALRYELERTQDQFLQQQEILTRIQGMFLHDQGGSSGGGAPPRTGTPAAMGALERREKTNPQLKTVATTAGGQPSDDRSSTPRPRTIPPPSDPIRHHSSRHSIPSSNSGDTSAGSHSARHSVEDQEDERDPPPVPSYRKDHPPHDHPSPRVAEPPQLSALSSSSQPRQDQRSKSAPRPSRAAVQEWLSSGSRDVAELERSPRAHHQFIVSKRSSTPTPTTKTATNGSGSDNNMVHAQSLLEHSKSNGNLAQGIRQGGVLASRAAERIKQSRQQQQQLQLLPKQTTPTTAPSSTTMTTSATSTKTPAKISFTMKLKPPFRSAAGKATTTRTTTTSTIRPSTDDNGTTPSSFFALKPTGLVATPPSSTSRRFDFDKYDDEYDDDDDREDVVEDSYSEEEEDPTIYSRSDWYD